LKVNTGVKSVRFSPGWIYTDIRLILFLRNLDGGELAIGLQNGTIRVFDVLGNGDFQLRTDGTSHVTYNSIENVFLYLIFVVS
jgi:hypothetical protein